MKNTKVKSSVSKMAKMMVEEIPTAKEAYFQGGSALKEKSASLDEDKMQTVSQVTPLSVQSFVYIAKREGFTKAKLIELINEEWKETRNL